MAGRGGAPSSPPPPPTALLSSSSVVCCMCGDYGLRRELFRCKFCITRFQHKYCSNLYPNAEDYQSCNWCLSDQGRKPAAAADSSSSTPSNKNINSGIGGSGMKLHRGAFPSHLSNPVKKPKLLIRSRSDVSLSTTRKEEISPGIGRGRQVMRGSLSTSRKEEISPGIGRGRQVMRGRVRRYKLLEEVSS